MAKVFGQDIPAFLYDQYKDILTLAVPHSLLKYGDYVRVLPSWREKLHVFESQEYKKIPPGRLAVWIAFKQACECWWKQKEEGQVWPPDIGPRDMQYWNMESLYERMGIFQFYMHKSIRPFYRTGTTDWCQYGPKRDVHVWSYEPDVNFAHSEVLNIYAAYGTPFYRFFIMKSEEEYDYTYLHLYCTHVWEGGGYQTPILAVWDIRQNFFPEDRLTWNYQPYFYDMITYQTIDHTGWYDIYTGKDWKAFGIKLIDHQEENMGYRFGCSFASMEYPIESLRPFWY